MRVALAGTIPHILVESQRLFDAKVLAVELQPLLAALLAPARTALRTMPMSAAPCLRRQRV